MVTEILQRHLPDTTCEFVRAVPSAVTTAWGVHWNEMQIARDVLQNFYDANRDRLEEVNVAMHGRDVRIAGPADFDVERLFYLGSEKTGEDIGQYGEGFKAAATCLLRDHGVNPIGISGSTLVHVRLADEPVPQTKLRPLMYDFYRISPSFRGALLLLPSCSPVLAKELQQGMAHFFFAGNPLLGRKIWPSWGNVGYDLYQSTTNVGHIFYRRLKRAVIDGIPVILVIHKPYVRIDKKVEKDRDRNAFGDNVLDLCYDVFAHEAASVTAAVQEILRSSRHSWEKGHALLSAVAKHRKRYTTSDTIASLFGNEYYAASPHEDLATKLRYDQVEAVWKQEGRRVLPAYFTAFGVPSAATHLQAIHVKARAEEQQKARAFTRAEHRGREVLLGALAGLAPVLSKLFETKNVRYSVADTEAILGALKEGRGYNSIEVYLAASVFTEDFSRALAVFLHEHAHVFGYDGSRGFTDALTELLEAVIHERHALDTLERDWIRAREGVIAERGASTPDGEQTFTEHLQTLDRDALLALLEEIPSTVLRPLLRNAGKNRSNS